MRTYLLIESQGPQEDPDFSLLLDLALRLRSAGHAVTVYLIQNAVLAVTASTVWGDIVDRGVEVLADSYSLAARGLDGCPRPHGVAEGTMPDLVRMLMADGTRAVWH